MIIYDVTVYFPSILLMQPRSTPVRREERRGFHGAMVRPEQDSSKDYYQILGLVFPCSASDIRKAFLDLARTQHPDKNPGRELEFQVKFQEITVAYDVLKEPSLKRVYDQVRPVRRQPMRPQRHQAPPAPARQSAYAHATSTASAQRAAAAAAGNAKPKTSFQSAYDWSNFFDNGPGFPRQAKTSPRRAPTAAAKPATPSAKSKPQSAYTKDPFPQSSTKPGPMGKGRPTVNKATKPTTAPQAGSPHPKAGTTSASQRPQSSGHGRAPPPPTATKPKFAQSPTSATNEESWWAKSKSAYSTTGAFGKFDPRTPEPATAAKPKAKPVSQESPFAASVPASNGTPGSAQFTPGGKKSQEEYQWQSSRTAYQNTPSWKAERGTPLDSDCMDDISSSASEDEIAHSGDNHSEDDFVLKSHPKTNASVPAEQTAQRKTAVPVSRLRKASLPHRASPAFASTFTPVNPTPAASKPATPQAASGERKFSFNFTPPVPAATNGRKASSSHMSSPLVFSKVPDFNFSSSSPSSKATQFASKPTTPASATSENGRPEKRSRGNEMRDARYSDVDMESESEVSNEMPPESESEEENDISRGEDTSSASESVIDVPLRQKAPVIDRFQNMHLDDPESSAPIFNSAKSNSQSASAPDKTRASFTSESKTVPTFNFASSSTIDSAAAETAMFDSAEMKADPPAQASPFESSASGPASTSDGDDKTRYPIFNFPRSNSQGIFHLKFDPVIRAPTGKSNLPGFDLSMRKKDTPSAFSFDMTALLPSKSADRKSDPTRSAVSSDHTRAFDLGSVKADLPTAACKAHSTDLPSAFDDGKSSAPSVDASKPLAQSLVSSHNDAPSMASSSKSSAAPGTRPVAPSTPRAAGHGASAFDFNTLKANLPAAPAAASDDKSATKNDTASASDSSMGSDTNMPEAESQTPLEGLSFQSPTATEYTLSPRSPSIPLILLREPILRRVDRAAYVSAFIKRCEIFKNYSIAWLKYERQILPRCLTDADERKAHWAAYRVHMVACDIHAALLAAHSKMIEQWSHT